MIDWEAVANLRAMNDFAKGLLINHDLADNYIPGDGDSPKAFIVKGSPDTAEAAYGKAFSGPYGNLTRQLMAIADLNSSNSWCTNVVKYRIRANQPVTDLHVDTFRDCVRAEWSAVGRPPIIITIGSYALQIFTGKQSSILRAAGKLHRYTNRLGQELYVWPMVDPKYAVALNDHKLQELLEEDWERLGNWRKKNGL